MKKKEVKIMKCIVETSGDFGLVSGPNEHIKHNRPSVVTFNSFVESRVLNGDLKVLARGLPREAEDADFAEILAEGKGNDIADIDAFCALFGLDKDGNEIGTEVETKAQKKAREKAEKEEADRIAKEEADKAEADRIAKEEADKADKAAEEAAKAAEGQQGQGDTFTDANA